MEAIRAFNLKFSKNKIMPIGFIVLKKKSICLNNNTGFKVFVTFFVN